MNDPLHCLKNGIRLENSDTLIPWNTPFEQLSAFGIAEKKSQKELEMVVWKNERILDGIKLDLNAVYEKGLCNKNRVLTAVTAYLCESSFQSAREALEAQFKSPPRFKKLNEIEYAFIWKSGNCEVVLSHLDRFGSYFRLDIRLVPGTAGISGLKEAIQKFFRKTFSAGATQVLSLLKTSEYALPPGLQIA
jgi:hypothetical protein